MFLVETILDDIKKGQILQYVLKGLIPPGIMCVQKSYIKDDFSILIRVILVDGSGIYGMLDAIDNLYLLSAWEWLELVGIGFLAQEYGIEPVEIAE